MGRVAERINTEWMWANEDGGVNGLKVDPDREVLEWFDEIGCACEDADYVQSYAHYHEYGPAFSNIPDDVVEQLERALKHFALRG
ncbi:MAG: hypothetical protein DWB44_08925 [Chloroflexi bacterium]|nr:hypothetical protein [Chloroflexota bacterium]OQY77620.1 MAG: hypothetical protein B6D42_16430 [Anaerolineae bacterium UTCFX5]RIK20811.1 MAG: hypothetical protein DCC53_09325 [Chloroflexota bacterium]